MMQGDQYRVPIKIRSGNTAVTADMVRDVEVMIGNDIRKLLSAGDISFDPQTLLFNVALKQEETFLLESVCEVQVRVAFLDGSVVGGTAGNVSVRNALSEAVI